MKPRLHSSTYKQGIKVEGLPTWMLHNGKLAHIPLLVAPNRMQIQRWDPVTLNTTQRSRGRGWR